ncbi:antitoxin VapB47 [Acidithrix ferrooxidans]|uniref:Antitoxin VapB47 n=2 Tax=Acidithrix ferrooxidans TaxID=1280514 RepID=A0A0D8HFV2_9ACTN|nr:antitoxin VapB47 [Acidithrix ferrooxidans]
MCYFIYMIRIGVKELRQNASKYLEQVKRGEIIEVTARGALVALISSPYRESDGFEGLVARGQIIPPVNQFQIPKHRRKLSPGVVSDDVLNDLREERFE